MVFVNIKGRENTSNYQQRQIRQYKCLNCGSIIADPTGSIQARRFCSMNCHEKYMSGD
ncbi:MAG: hypothetical protein ABID38_07225 [Candidatus Diapherotrites archaeon]